jgi:hypothetical protein
MTLFRTFLAHELRMQFRSGRFRLLATVYTIACVLPLLVPFAIARRAEFIAGPGLFAAMIDCVQPLATAFVAAMLAIDALSREQQERSFDVIALAPVTSSGYATRRWLSVVAILIPLTLAPLAIAAATSYAHTSAVSDALAWKWLLKVLPIAVLYSAVAFALGTITSRTTLAAILGFGIFTFGVGLVNDLLARVHRQLAFAEGGIGMRRDVTELVDRLIRGWGMERLPTETPFDIRGAFDDLLPRLGLFAAIAALLLALAPFFLRRTRRDVRPWRIPADHSLRTFLKSLNRIREEYTPDGAVEWRELIVLAGAFLFAGCCFTALFARETHYQRLAAERFAAESSTLPAPTGNAITPDSLRIDGSIGGDGTVHTRATLQLRNGGDTPIGTLAFQVNPSLTVTASRAAGIAAATRRWNRLAVTLEPPLAAHAAERIVFDVAGTPGDIIFPIWSPFVEHYRAYRDAKDAVELRPLASTDFIAAVNRTRVELPLSDLAPLLRFAAWDATDEIAVPLRVTLALRVPHDIVIADSCGATARAGRLDATCISDPAKHLLAGGRLDVLPVTANARLAVLRAHRTQARIHAASLARALELAEHAWPGAVGNERIMFIERPLRPREQYWAHMPLDPSDVSGSVQMLPEAMFSARRSMNAGRLATTIVANALFTRRRVVRAQSAFFREFFVAVAASRSGQPVHGGAVEPAIGGSPASLAILDPNSNSLRLRRVLVDIENRVGSDRLVAGINDFLDARRESGDAKELLDAIARRGGVSLDRIYRDYFAGNAEPRLTLRNVLFTRVGDRWRVTGTLRNDGSGEAFCPIVLRTAYESATRVLRADTGESIDFAIDTPYVPRALQLDPENVCYRFAAIGSVDNVTYRGDR